MDPAQIVWGFVPIIAGIVILLLRNHLYLGGVGNIGPDHSPPPSKAAAVIAVLFGVVFIAVGVLVIYSGITGSARVSTVAHPNECWFSLSRE
jgi:uncharacterized membrane protein HdeD (DUF308 family)